MSWRRLKDSSVRISTEAAQAPRVVADGFDEVRLDGVLSH